MELYTSHKARQINRDLSSFKGKCAAMNELKTDDTCIYHMYSIVLQWNLPILDTLGTVSDPNREVSSFQGSKSTQI